MKEFKPKPKQVRLILDDGTQQGVVSYFEASVIAKERQLDLVCVTDKADPPVYKICDKGKWFYEQSRKDKKNKQKQRQSVIETKEMQFKLMTQQHDLEVKANKIKNFININKKVKLVVKLFSRQIQQADKGVVLLDKVKEMIPDTEWEQKPTVNHNKIIAILTNGKRN
jgi:translation initiation factor IF-3